ncbi:MAG TPA: hypothetical protein VG498_21035, partial [Terriglobales bacterium]|nr:hypothetical protein [Terriglobales bacterium]
PTGFAGPLTAMCLNLPSGVTCSFDSASSSIIIQTAATTPKGAHVLTIVFNAQTLAQNVGSPTLLASSLGALGLPLGGIFISGSRARRKLRIAFLVVLLGAILLMLAGCGGYGGSGGTQSNPTPQTQSAQSSAALTLTVQ